MLSVYVAVRVRPFPNSAARAERVRSLDPDIAGVERKGIAAFDAVPLEGHRGKTAPSVHSRRKD